MPRKKTTPPHVLTSHEVCYLFDLDPKINPRTNRKISGTGKVHKSLVNECKDMTLLYYGGSNPHLNVPSHIAKIIKARSKSPKKKKSPSGSPRRRRRRRSSSSSSSEARRRRRSSTKATKKSNRVIISSEDCSKWSSQPRVNPLTGRSIKVNGPVWKKLEKSCGPAYDNACFKCGGERNPHSQLCPWC